MLRRIAIKGFKSLVDVELELPRLAVLAGPNAAGKSNLLDAIQMLARAGTQRTLADALGDPIRGFPDEAFTLPAGGLPGLLAQPSASFELEADLEIEAVDEPERVRYRVGVEIDRTGALSVAEEYLTVLGAQQPRIAVVDGELILRPWGQDRPKHEPLRADHTLVSDARLAGRSYPLLDLVRAELLQWRTYYLDPQTVMRAAESRRGVLDIGTRGEHLAPFLYGLKARNPPAFAAVQRTVRAVIPAITGLEVDFDTKRGTLDIQIEQDGTLFSSRVASDGTLRVLALCAIAVTASSGLVAFEEPENGVHPQRLDRIAELLASIARRGSAQILVTTHSPGFVAAMLARARSEEEDVGLFGVGRDGRDTVIHPVRDPGIWSEPALDELLQDPDDQDKVMALARRGWLDL